MLLAATLLALLQLAQQDYLADATKALDADQPAVAEPLLRKAIEANPNDYFAHFNLGLALSLQDKDSEAITEFRTTLQQKPGLYEAELNLGMVLLRDKQPAEAVSVLKEAAAVKPTDPTPNFYLAQAFFDTGDAEQALQHYRLVAEADPKSARAQYGIGRSLLRMGKRDEAAPYYQAAAALDLDYRDRLQELTPTAPSPSPPQNLPSEYDRIMNSAKGLRDTHQSQKAAEQFLAATKLRPEAVEPWRELAALLVEEKNYTQGLAALDRAKALAPETPGQLYFRAISLDGLRQHKPAIEAYRQFLAVAGGKFPNQEFLSRQRVRIIEEEIKRGAK
jgi:tetratricopeptide (TPR) repeat protein